MQRPVINTETGSNPGAPLAWGSPENPDDAVAGYGYVSCDTSEVEETFYYHSDHLGSTSYITDQNANVTQYDAYLPYGELLVDEHSSSADLPYKFNGKELDEETGLYYYGARYMNPVTSMWYGVDPLCEEYVATGAYVYCVGNPITLIDPDGQKYIYNMQGQFLRKEGNDNLVYIDSNGRLSPLFDHGQHMNDRQFNIAAHIVAHESGGDATASLWIAHTANNAVSDRDINWKKNRNKTLFEQLNDRNYSTTPDAAHEPYDNNQYSASRNSARAAIIDALVSSVDPTGGCVLWDGTDFIAYGLEGPANKEGKREAHPKFREYKTISIDRKTFERYCEAQFKKYPKRSTTYLNKKTRQRDRFNIPAPVFGDPTNWGPNGFSYSYPGSSKRRFSLRAQNSFGGSIFWKKER